MKRKSIKKFSSSSFNAQSTCHYITAETQGYASINNLRNTAHLGLHPIKIHIIIMIEQKNICRIEYSKKLVRSSVDQGST